ncbi:unnamed protein product [Lupinus luteus]|uniref:Uncharacterized protein n=1 Tax=Lupinus luteus TaxID=3873 RepID=A0AAV1XIC0_LUPLU
MAVVGISSVVVQTEASYGATLWCAEEDSRLVMHYPPLLKARTTWSGAPYFCPRYEESKPNCTLKKSNET